MRIFLILLFLFPLLKASGGLLPKGFVVVKSTKIAENSGLDLSYKYPGAAWTHNDSGGKPYLYLVSLSTGNTLATVMLEKSINKDWEDIATFRKGGKSYIVVADIGDNHRRRKGYQICLLEEPDVEIDHNKNKDSKSDVIPVTEWIDLQFKYSDGAKNAESIGYDRQMDSLIIIEKMHHKLNPKTGVFQLKLPTVSRHNVVAKRIGTIKSKDFSALDTSDDGKLMLARAYHQGYLLERSDDETWMEVFNKPLPEPIQFPFQRQGEGVCFAPNLKSVLISTEKKQQPIIEVPLIQLLLKEAALDKTEPENEDQ